MAITLRGVSYRYPDQSELALSDLNLQIEAGEFLVVAGASGSGKSSLLRLFNGLIPHFHGGTLSGSVQVWGRNTIGYQPRDLADLIGFVFQDPEAQMVVDVVEDEIAFAMENLGLSQAIMRRRIEEVLDQLALAPLRRRRLATLSGGERQRVAIAAALAAQPQALVLDEPTSQLDPHGAEEVLSALQKLNADLGITIIISEHRLERVAQYADRLLWMERGRITLVAPPREVLAQTPQTPPLQRLARALGWQPLPLTIKEGRRIARHLAPRAPISAAQSVTAPSTPAPVRCEAASVRYGSEEALYRVSFSLAAGTITALMGRNGSGKSSLFKALLGLVPLSEGRIWLFGQLIQRNSLAQLAQNLAYIPQDPRSVLFHETLSAELAASLHAHREPADQARIEATLRQFGLVGLAARHPRDLSGGEAQRAALAALLIHEPRLMLLDEPTRGLDYAAKAELSRLLLARRAAGATILIATHDVELVAGLADHLLLLGDGELVVAGDPHLLLRESLHFSPQIAKLFPQSTLLTAEAALAALR